MVRRTALPLLICFSLLACAAPALADSPPRPGSYAQQASPAGPLLEGGKARAAGKRRDLLWATVNVCDTFDSPDAMGVRASMPGNGRAQRMYMRFSAQWWSGMRQQWLDVAGGTSPWVYVGSARYVSRQMGWTFDFATPSIGRAYVLRGTVEFQWRRKPRGAKRSVWRVARRHTMLTKTGVDGVDGGDPKGTSKAMCAIANLG